MMKYQKGEVCCGLPFLCVEAIPFLCVEAIKFRALTKSLQSKNQNVIETLGKLSEYMQSFLTFAP